MGVLYALGMTENDAFGAFARECLLCALRNEVAFYFSGKPECERKHLRRDVGTKSVVVLDRPYLRLTLEAFIEDRHYHQKAASKARKFRADDDVALVDALEELAEFSLLWFLCAGDRLLDPTVDDDPLLFAEARNLKTLILNRLLVCAYANVSVVHLFVLSEWGTPP